jgi:hypothetical protein
LSKSSGIGCTDVRFVCPELSAIRRSEGREMNETTGHVAYPHTPGYLYDCPGCENECNCSPAVGMGTEMPCIYCEELSALTFIEKFNDLKEEC